MVLVMVLVAIGVTDFVRVAIVIFVGVLLSSE